MFESLQLLVHLEFNSEIHMTTFTYMQLLSANSNKHLTIF